MYKNSILLVFFVFHSLIPAARAASVRDESGKMIEISKPFCRIISLYGAHTENLYAMGLDKEIIGVSANETYPPQALKKPIFGYHDDAEKFMAAKPDLVLIRPMIATAHAQFVEKLEKAGIAVISLQPVGIADMYEYWKNLGILTGKEKQALDMTARFRIAIERIDALVSGIPKEKRKRVYFEAIHDKMRTFSPEAIAMFVLTKAGGINVASDAVPRRNTNIADYGKERILSRAGEIEVYLAQSGTMNRITPDIIEKEPGFAAIWAVRNHQVHVVDELLVSRPTLRLLNGIFGIGKILYPQVFTDTVRKEIG
jgi:iron complex transport system substrate-binding protein